MKYKIAEFNAMELIQYTYDKNKKAFMDAADMAEKENAAAAGGKKRTRAFPDPYNFKNFKSHEIPFKKVCFEYDMSNPAVNERILESVQEHNDNALFYQIRECAQMGHGSFRTSSDSLEKKIVYVDFSDIYPKKNDISYDLNIVSDNVRYDILEALFKYGFILKYNKEKITYVPFDKSSNMARQSKISFIDKSLLDSDNEKNIEKRLCLDIDFSAFKLYYSKYYAYRGLYMSDAKRAELESDYPLNEETVIVLPKQAHVKENDNTVSISHGIKKEIDIITADNEAYSTNGEIKIEEKQEKLQLTAFDGEGLISPEYSAHINKCMGYSSGAVSYQIRMPFIKGMLHRVDFKGFIREYVLSGTDENVKRYDPEKFKIINEDGSEESIKILDYYGKWRELSKAQVIVPESMFKAAGWLGEYKEALEKEAAANPEKNNKISVIDDPMKYYFEKFKEYSHGFYICSTNLTRSRDDTRLNYQFLNPLALTQEEFLNLVKKHIDYAQDIVQLKRSRIKSRYERGRKLQAWEYALMVNPAFAKDKYISGLLKTEQESMIRDIGLGKLNVQGCQRILSDDLLSFLKYMVMCLNVSDDAASAAAEKIKIEVIYDDKFYLPGGEKFALSEKKYYGFFRNPHLSRNEECALRPYIPDKNNVYTRYFGHLEGIVMLSYNSIAPRVLGGADFDGDFVQIYFDEDINRALLRGAYRNIFIEKKNYSFKKDKIYKTGFSEETENQEASGEKKGTENINGECCSAEEKDSETSVYKYFSNIDLLPLSCECALGLKEINEIRKERLLPVAEITPPSSNKETLSSKRGNVYYEKMFKVMDNTFSNSVGIISDTAIVLGKKAYFGTPAEQEKYRPLAAAATIITGLDIDAAKSGRHPDITRWMKQNEIKSAFSDQFIKYKSALKKGEKKENAKGLRLKIPEYDKTAPLFSFAEENFDIDADDEKALKIIRTYKKYKSFKAVSAQKKKKAVFTSDSESLKCLHKILKAQYDYAADLIPETADSIQNAADGAFRELYQKTGSADDIDEAVKELKKQQWEFALKEEREEKLSIILDKAFLKYSEDGHTLKEKTEDNKISAQTKALLIDPSAEGYLVLYFMLKAISEIKRKSERKDSGKESFQSAGEINLSMPEEAENVQQTDYFFEEPDSENEDEENDAVSFKFFDSDIEESKSEYDDELYEKIKLICLNGRSSKLADSIIDSEVRSQCLEKIKELFTSEEENGEKHCSMNAAIEYVNFYREKKVADESGSFFWEIFDFEDLTQAISCNDAKRSR